MCVITPRSDHSALTHPHPGEKAVSPPLGARYGALVRHRGLTGSGGKSVEMSFTEAAAMLWGWCEGVAQRFMCWKPGAQCDEVRVVEL
jgi:hypothetical protein